MNFLSALGSQFFPQMAAPKTPAQSLTSAWQSHDSLAQSLVPQDDNVAVALSDLGKILAQQNGGDASSLLQRASDLGSATIDAALSFITGFAKSLFGNSADGMNLSFDTSSISASSGFSGALQHTESNYGSSDAAAVRLEDAADFQGTGTITTADGQRFSFAVEVHYESTLEVSAASSSTTNGGAAGNKRVGGSDTVPTREGLAAHFPGSAADLFKTLNRGSLRIPFQWQANDTADALAKSGNLTLRLLNQLPHPDTMAGKMAKAYGETPSASTV